jgi:hypothetical protein
MSDTEQRTRELAYRLWEEAGRPDGRDDDFWHAASDLTAAQLAEGAAPPSDQPAAEPAPAASAPPPKAAPVVKAPSPAEAAPKGKPVAARAAAVAVDKPTTAGRKPPSKKG